MASNEQTIQLKYGDIIEISSPSNDEYHQNSYYIIYIDSSVLEFINVSTMKTHKISIKENKITDESIIAIYLLSRGDVDGYARQNNLNTHTWLDIHIGGDVPVIITGKITNLEEDMIEITTFPERDVIYIDFAYKGIPKDIPFHKFVIREQPSQALSDFTKNITDEEKTEDEDTEKPVELGSFVSTDDGEMIINTPDNAVPDENIREVLHKMYNDANDIIFGEDLDDTIQEVEIPEYQQKYGLEIQTNDMMDELLSTIPDSKRTDKVRSNISLLINRFKELRNEFSKFDENDNVTGYVYNGPLWKPLVDKLVKINKNIRWIIPVVQQQSNVYMGLYNDDDEDIDVNLLDQSQIMSRENEIYNSYKNNDTSSSNKYFKLYSDLDKYNTNFNTKDDNNSLINKASVKSEFDTVIDNLENFYGSVVKVNGNRSRLAQRRFVIQRYNMGLQKQDSVLMRSGKTIFIRNNMTPDDEINIKSLIMMPRECVEFSKVDLPSTSIMKKSQYSQHFVSLFRLLKQNTRINTDIINDLDTEVSIEENAFMKDMKHYTLSEKYKDEPNKYEKFLQTIIPKTRTIIKEIRDRVKNRLTIHSFIEELKPYMVDNKDISYQQQNELRFTIKTAIQDFNKNFVEKSRTFQTFYSQVTVQEEQMTRIERLLFNNTELMGFFKDGYNISDGLKLRNGELLNKLIQKDNLTMLSDIITSMNIKHLTTPEQLLNGFQPVDIEDEGENAKIKPTDCLRRYLAKKYNTINELQSDNNSDVIYYDDEFDDTPYELLDLYKKEKKEMEPSLFKEFLEENLVQKHNVQSNYASDMSEILIAGKKPINNGEYAVLELKPGYGQNIDETLLTPKEKKAYEIESETRKKQGYYKRMNNQWTFDRSIDAEAFIDTNALFCNTIKECNNNTSNNICEPSSFSKKRIEQLNKARMVKEFENRVDISLEQLNEKVKQDLMNDFKNIRKKTILTEMKETKYNNLAYDYGKTVSSVDTVQSPNEELRKNIMGLDNFTLRQNYINKFVAEHCRVPLEDMKEDMNWMYCVDSNTPILPMSIVKLSREFILNQSNYLHKLDEICSIYGTISDDGDSVVDKYSGYVLRKIDFMTQETFNEQGFVIQTHDIMEKDMTEQLKDVLSKQVQPVYENALNSMLSNIANTLSTSMGILFESIEEGVLRLSNELVDSVIINEIRYEEQLLKIKKKSDKKGINYETYRHRNILWIVAASLLVNIQTAIPGHRSNKTFPGCKRSFNGYPLKTGDEDQSSIEYIACIMYKLKSSIKPWDAISKLKVDMYVTKIKDIIEKNILEKRPDIVNLYMKKREFLTDNPEQFIPEEHGSEKWKHFLPPIVPLIIPRVQPLTRDFERNFLDTVKKGHSDQLKLINTIQSKSSMFGFSISNSINAVVNKEKPLVKTNADIPFLENSCCNSGNDRAIDFFTEKDPIIQQTITASKSISDLLNEIKLYSKPSILFHNEFTGIKRIVVKEQTTEEHIYAYIIKHSNFDNILPVPDAYKIVSGEKLEDFPQQGSMNDKIDFLKRNGRKYTISDLNHLTRIVRQSTVMEIEKVVYFTQVDVMFDILDKLDVNNSESVDDNFRRHLRTVLNTYTKNVMVSEKRPELTEFKNYLFASNKKMFKEIVIFIKEYGNLNKSKFNKLQDTLLSVYSSDNTSSNDVLNNISGIENSIYYFTKVYPEIILTGKTYNKIAKHWGLSDIHNRDLSKIVQNHWSAILQLHGDKTLVKTLRNISENTSDIYSVLSFMPRHLSIFKEIDINGKLETKEFYSILDNAAMGYMHGYLFLSVLYDYISSANNIDMLNSDIELKKSQARTEIKNTSDITAQTRAIDMVDERDELTEFDITTNDAGDLKRRIASVLILFMDLQENQRKSYMSYKDISKKIHNSKVKEKQKIVTQDLGKLDNDVRRVENLLKKYKMGRWNIGLQKGLIHYDKNTYNRERTEMDGDNLVAEDADELDAIMEQDINQQYDEEANDLRNLGEDFNDGNYYNDIPEDNDFGDE